MRSQLSRKDLPEIKSMKFCGAFRDSERERERERERENKKFVWTLADKLQLQKTEGRNERKTSQFDTGLAKHTSLVGGHIQLDNLYCSIVLHYLSIVGNIVFLTFFYQISRRFQLVNKWVNSSDAFFYYLVLFCFCCTFGRSIVRLNVLKSVRL